jgi:hypothetical protein
MKFVSSTLAHGLIAQVIGHITGMLFAMLVRLIMGLPAWKAEPVWVVGGLFGAVC